PNARQSRTSERSSQTPSAPEMLKSEDAQEQRCSRTKMLTNEGAQERRCSRASRGGAIGCASRGEPAQLTHAVIPSAARNLPARYEVPVNSVRTRIRPLQAFSLLSTFAVQHFRS